MSKRLMRNLPEEISMTDRMVHIIGGIKDEEKLKRLLAACLARTVELLGKDEAKRQLDAAQALIAMVEEHTP